MGEPNQAMKTIDAGEENPDENKTKQVVTYLLYGIWIFILAHLIHLRIFYFKLQELVKTVRGILNEVTQFTFDKYLQRIKN